MDTRDKNQERAAEGFMTPDSGMSQAPIEMNLTVLTDSDVAITLGENELKDLKEPLKKSATPFQESMRRLRRDKRAMASVGVIIFFVLLALFGPFFYQHIGGIYNSPIAGPIGPEVYH
ncbi:MAG: ABC transporter permease, partial [Ktedonobacteraceae bacterium]